MRIGTLALIFSLCIVNFLTFYFAQLYALIEALGQVFLLVVASLYRWRFLDVTSRGEGEGRSDGSRWMDGGGGSRGPCPDSATGGGSATTQRCRRGLGSSRSSHPRRLGGRA